MYYYYMNKTLIHLLNHFFSKRMVIKMLLNNAFCTLQIMCINDHYVGIVTWGFQTLWV
jgi:hypothetical protein